jgi:hypothetical protein
MTLGDIAKALDAAIQAVNLKKSAAEAAKKAASDANAAYFESLSKVKELHTEYQKQMDGVLSGFGQIHK